MNNREKVMSEKNLMPNVLPTMTKTVAWLNAQGFNTTDSGDGVSNAGMGCEIPRAHVFIQLTDGARLVEESHRLMRLAQERWPDVRVSIEGTYSPVDGVGILMLWDVTDAAPTTKVSLREGIERIRELLGDDLEDYDPGALLEELRGKPGEE